MEQKAGWDDVEVVIVGPGLMGSNIAQAYAQNGVPVGIIGRNEAALRRSTAMIERELKDGVAKGIFNPTEAEEIKQHILPGLSLKDASRVNKVQLVIESIAEDFSSKEELLERLDELFSPAAVLATVTSCQDAEVLAKALRRPERFVWMHFFFPAHKNKAGELARLSLTSEESLTMSDRYFRKAGKEPVRLLRYRKGGAANVIFIALLLEAARLMEEGFNAAAVEQASREAFSLPAGFVSLLSMVGQKLATSCLASFSDTSCPDHPFHRVYDNFFKPPKSLPTEMLARSSFSSSVSSEERTVDAMALDYLKRRFLAVAFMTATEVVEAGLLPPQDVDKLCRMAFSWPKGPFALMNQMGLRESLRIVTEKMELSHRREINFPVPRLLIEQAQRDEPWPDIQSLPS